MQVSVSAKLPTTGRTTLPPLPPPWARSASRGLTRLVIRHYFRTVHVGREHIPRSGGALLIGNHPSYLDPWLVAFGTPRWVTWLAWDAAFDWPVLGRIVSSMGSVPLNLSRAAPSSLKAAYEVLARDRLLGMFLEGERSRGFELGPARRGAARLALQANVPVVPVTLAGMRKLWPRDGLPRPGPVTVTYHPVIHPEQVAPTTPLRDREQALTELICRSIRSALPRDGSHKSRARSDFRC